MEPVPAPHRTRGAQKLVILANKYAGTLARMRGQTSLEQFARDAGFEPEIIYTQSSSHLRRILRERVVGKLDRVAIAGGDGTLHAATQELANTNTVLGILAQGTANNLATALRLPRDLPSAFRTIAEGDVRAIDLGEIDGYFFTEGAGVGVFADTLAIASVGRTKSIPRTLRTLLQLIITNRQYRLTLVVDGVQYTEEVLNVVVANTYCLGLNLPIAPHARLTDSRLDVVVIKALQRREWIPYLKAIRTQSHLNLPKIVTFTGREIEIRSRRPINVHIDDRASRRTPVKIRVADKALKVMVDRL
jgi:diacylglycerol kinase family enzyme